MPCCALCNMEPCVSGLFDYHDDVFDGGLHVQIVGYICICWVVLIG